VTVDGVWIGTWIYCTRNYNRFTNSHIPQLSTARARASSLHRLLWLYWLSGDGYQCVASLASVFTSLLAGYCLTTKSVLLRNGLQQWVLLRLPRRHQGRLSHNCLILRLISLPADSLYTRLTWVRVLCYDRGQSASLSWNKAPIWGLRPVFYYCQTVAGLFIWGAFFDERTCLSFTIAAVARQRHIFLSQIRDFPYHGGIRPRLHTESTDLYFNSPDIASARTRQKTQLPTILLMPRDVTANTDITCRDVLLCCVLVWAWSSDIIAVEICFKSHCLATAISTGFTFPTLSRMWQHNSTRCFVWGWNLVSHITGG
jgi:hypothetical protein